PVVKAADDGKAAITLGGKLDLTLDTITLQGGGAGDPGMGAAGGDGVRCAGGVNRPQLSLSNVMIQKPKGQGVDASTCSLTLDRVRIFESNLEGLSMSDTDFAITNTVVAKAGT